MNSELALKQKVGCKMRSKEKVNLLLLAVFTLFFFCTLLQPYLKGILLYSLVILWFISALFIDTRWLYKSKVFLLAVIGYSVIVLADGVAGKTQTEIDNLIKSYVYSFAFMLMGVFYACNYRKFSFKYYFLMLFAALLISNICTIVGLRQYPTASRDLASGNSELSETFKKLGIGGYSFIYQTPYIVALLLLMFSMKMKLWKKLVLIASVILFSYTVLKSNYTTAFLTVIMAIVLSVCFKSGRNNVLKIMVLLLLVITAYIFRVQILEIGISFFDQDSVIAMRLSELLDSLRPGSDITFNRINLMLKSFDAFAESPIIGGFGKVKTIGGHSDFIDSLGRFGLIGFFFYNLIFFEVARVQYKMLKTKKCKTYFILIQFLFFFNRLTNTVMSSQGIFAVVFLLVPVMLLIIEQKYIEKYVKKYVDEQ